MLKSILRFHSLHKTYKSKIKSEQILKWQNKGKKFYRIWKIYFYTKLPNRQPEIACSRQKDILP